jgi:hypothetical protein
VVLSGAKGNRTPRALLLRKITDGLPTRFLELTMQNGHVMAAGFLRVLRYTTRLSWSRAEDFNPELRPPQG